MEMKMGKWEKFCSTAYVCMQFHPQTAPQNVCCRQRKTPSACCNCGMLAAENPSGFSLPLFFIYFFLPVCENSFKPLTHIFRHLGQGEFSVALSMMPCTRKIDLKGQLKV